MRRPWSPRITDGPLVGGKQDCTEAVCGVKGHGEPATGGSYRCCPVTPRTTRLLEELAGILNGLPAVFSTPQWGGRAYKVRTGAGGKFKLLAHVTVDGTSVHIGFKLPPQRARDAVERYGWIAPSAFRTLAPSGWVSAEVTTRRQLAVLGRLLGESHRLYGAHVPEKPARKAPSATEPGPAARHIDRVMNELADQGWQPPSDW